MGGRFIVFAAAEAGQGKEHSPTDIEDHAAMVNSAWHATLIPW